MIEPQDRNIESFCSHRAVGIYKGWPGGGKPVASHLVSSSSSALGSITVRQEPCRRLSREGTAVVHQMHLIVEVVIVGDAAPRTARRSELVVQSSVKSDDSSVEFRRHAHLSKETPLELSW